MPPLMSFAKTVDAMERDEKDVTRRDGWRNLRAGDIFEAVDRSPRGGKGFRRLGLFRVVSERWERPGDITPEDVTREGFGWLAGTHPPGDSAAAAFARIYCAPGKPNPDRIVHRIEFRRLAEGEDPDPLAEHMRFLDSREYGS